MRSFSNTAELVTFQTPPSPGSWIINGNNFSLLFGEKIVRRLSFLFQLAITIMKTAVKKYSGDMLRKVLLNRHVTLQFVLHSLIVRYYETVKSSGAAKIIFHICRKSLWSYPTHHEYKKRNKGKVNLGLLSFMPNVKTHSDTAKLLVFL